MKAAKRIVAFTGAGVSQESGVPTFRDHNGLWENHRFEEVATPEGFQADPVLVWRFYMARRQLAKQVKPNAAHLAIAGWEKQFSFAGVVTQNIDGLHAQAGSRHVQELHGNIWKTECSRCHRVEVNEATELSADLPHCRDCGGLLRPHVVWFGEALNESVVHEALLWLYQADVIIVIGTSGAVEPAASFVREAKQKGAYVIEINTQKTALTPFVDLTLYGKSAELLGGPLRI
ncbi:MAG: NAD-dependent deacylase [Candidatus Omnitrophica bacterium CG11_big_fil_rev_8_21_14_0_20_45_26]|uniref:NAD-dependent protein deacylase n=1 Tax=Candidatus Abzuiibacterium crystallinum TaxID=1974748 RepID=A0A2H0LTC4_9BACT|nr:MAG: NAD-dependent deacylase [Candidatus Omnitrophica bacterium CG11_big_fil_rev_8_21_14_0_20_45_26]PIW65791.1 MAG: NAD-dependent deacylase [Candidatus Omnitrophica bacterium CG12_big_fil_rev_8_21_14_0_65_45_16]